MAADTSDPAVAAAIADVKNPSTSTSWVLLTYEKQTTKIKVAAKGDGGLDEFKEELNDGKIFFGFIRFNIGGVWKFVYISWCGEGVVGMLKGRFNNHCKDLERFLHGFHIQINARVEGDLDENAIKGKLTKAQGSNYDAGQKVQGTKKGGVTSVAQGQEKALKPKERKINKIDDGKVGIDKKDDFWSKQNQDDERSKPQPKLQRADPNYTVEVDKRNKFWQENKEERSIVTPQRNEPAYNKKQESTDYWSKVNADDDSKKSQAKPPSRPAPGKIKPAPQHVPEPEPEPVVEEPVAQTEEPVVQTYEEPAQTYEEPAVQTYEEPAQTYEEPAVQTYEEPAQTYEEPPQEQNVQQAKALYDYAGEAEGDLSFSAGDVITIHDTSDPGGWWQGELNGVVGVFPSNFVETIN